MADAEAFWQDVEQEAANELVGSQSHRLLPVGDIVARILVA